VVSDAAPDFVKTVTAAMLAGLGDALPVSALPPDGTWPMGTTRWEKRNIAEAIPIWKEELCTQCNHCVAACPTRPSEPRWFLRRDGNRTGQPALAGCEIPDMRGQKYVLQVALKTVPAVTCASKCARRKIVKIRTSKPSI
jgi:pyruvate-ferredoxin/flavodoxin oxidoreductase